MVNCWDSYSYKEDNDQKLYLLFWKKYGLKDLTFSKYKQQQLQNAINILDFNSEKVELKEIGETFLSLFDNKPLVLKIKAFCGITRRGKNYIRKKC